MNDEELQDDICSSCCYKADSGGQGERSFKAAVVYLFVSFEYFSAQRWGHQLVCADLLVLPAAFVCWHCTKACFCLESFMNSAPLEVIHGPAKPE